MASMGRLAEMEFIDSGASARYCVHLHLLLLLLLVYTIELFT